LRITREIKTAILVISAILLFIWGYSFLKGRDLFADYKTFYVQYDNVEGLVKSAPVTLNGLVIGKVSDIKLHNTTGKLVVEIQVNSDFPISNTSTMMLYEPGLIGGKQIQIVPDLSNTVLAQNGDTLKGGVKPGLTDLVGEKLTPLQEKLESTISNADILLNNLNSVLDAKSRENLRNSMANLDKTLEEFRAAGSQVNSMLAENQSKIKSTLTNVDKASANFAKISDSIARADLAGTIRNLQQSSDKFRRMMTDAEAGKGTFGKLLADETLYNNLSKSSRELELLLQDLRLNPTRYINVSVFGKKNRAYQPPVEDPAHNP
jgi:phospholipid/cholesterol/gamma-HCH transport system substrate-binding protein